MNRNTLNYIPKEATKYEFLNILVAYHNQRSIDTGHKTYTDM
jgi:hypothetical protein